VDCFSKSYTAYEILEKFCVRDLFSLIDHFDFNIIWLIISHFALESAWILQCILQQMTAALEKNQGMHFM
jgi:hypothetical protein